MIRVVVLQQRCLDRDALAALIRQSKGLSLLAALTTDWETVAVSRSKRPDVVIIDTMLRKEVAISVATCVLNNSYTGHVLFLGDSPNEEWKAATSKIANSGHLTRDVSHADFLGYLAQHCLSDQTSADESLQATANPTRTQRIDAAALLKLTARESEVFRLLADGYTVQQCAHKLGLAHSTIDNHKSRLMRKLNAHSTVELVKLAIREGIVTP